jgi:hypothetical protein
MTDTQRYHAMHRLIHHIREAVDQARELRGIVDYAEIIKLEEVHLKVEELFALEELHKHIDGQRVGRIVFDDEKLIQQNDTF